MELKRAALRQALDVRYSANQPRVLAGVREGGQWSGSGGGGAHTAAPSAPAPKVGAGGNDPRVISDANPDAIVPGSLAARRTDLSVKYLRLRSKAAGLRVEMELKRAFCED